MLEKKHPISVDLSRGDTATFDVRFETPVDINARAVLVEPAARYEGMLPWVIRPWEGFEHRDVESRSRGGVSSNAKEVILQGQHIDLFHRPAGHLERIWRG